MRSILTGCALLVLLSSSPTANASGSVTLQVVTRRHALTIAQTFRKILRRGQGQRYYAGVRQQFLKIAGGLTPSLARFVDGIARRRVRSLGEQRLDYPLVICRERSVCPPPNAVFPAIVRLAPIQRRDDSRLAYYVSLPFMRKPGVGELAWLRAEIARIVERSGGQGEHEPLAALQLAPLEHPAGELLLRLRASIWVPSGERGWFEGQQRRFLVSLARALRSELKNVAGVRLRRFDKSLGYYGDSKRLPAIVSATRWDERYHLVALVGVASATSPERVEALRRALARALDTLAQGRRR